MNVTVEIERRDSDPLKPEWACPSCKQPARLAEVRANLDKIRVINVKDERFGGAALPFHWKVSDPGGQSIVIELVNGGEVKVYDAFQGVITNAPTYDWHLTNLRNHIGLSPAAEKPITIDGRTFSPLGAGTGLRGLPGDFTPPMPNPWRWPMV